MASGSAMTPWMSTEKSSLVTASSRRDMSEWVISLVKNSRVPELPPEAKKCMGLAGQSGCRSDQVRTMLCGSQAALSWAEVISVAKVLCAFTTTVMPSQAMGTSMISTPCAWPRAISASVMQRDASAMGMRPAMSWAMPAPEPLWPRLGLGCPALVHCSTMAAVMGYTVLEPSMASGDSLPPAADASATMADTQYGTWLRRMGVALRMRQARKVHEDGVKIGWKADTC